MRAAWAQTAGSDQPIVTRSVPSTGEALPAIGLGSFLTFDVLPGRDRAFVGEVLSRFWQAGGRVVDTSPLYGTGEISIGDAACAQGINREMFVANKIWSTGDFLADESHALRSLVQSQERLWREQIDLMQCHSLVNVDIVVPYLRAWKEEGRIRHLGVTHFENVYFAPLAAWIERGGLDFVQVNYSIFNREAERRIFPAAADRGTAVLVNMPFEKARLFKVVENQPLPGFAAEIGASTWAQFFLKWVMGHPAVTCVLPATSNPDHVVDNMAALRGSLPDAAMRERMVRHMETLPGFADIGAMAWYPDKRYPGIIARAQGALRERT
ncbi:aldo/keto reductase [Marinivivus vitaminiproducens]|uniref:aldo/keto reductase n=1 Tax=Marinivivus vitaminiproducens TaxID=3035935 RepID=UPI00279B2F12|nr:aldo/keto reductase [Geminicoccaceae bacterium SCSIO 64248]